MDTRKTGDNEIELCAQNLDTIRSSVVNIIGRVNVALSRESIFTSKLETTIYMIDNC